MSDAMTRGRRFPLKKVGYPGGDVCRGVPARGLGSKGSSPSKDGEDVHGLTRPMVRVQGQPALVGFG